MCTLSGPIVYSWCRRSGLQDSDAADVVQEVFRAVFQHLKEFQARGGVFHAWLGHITANQIRQHFRQHRRLPLVCLGQQAEEIVDPGPPPDWENEWEQAKGEKVDARADLYSLGVVLYRMATGQLTPVGARHLQYARDVGHRATPPDPGIGPRSPARVGRSDYATASERPSATPQLCSGSYS